MKIGDMYGIAPARQRHWLYIFHKSRARFRPILPQENGRRLRRGPCRETLERLVRENDKQRYTFNSDHTKIRANQGHSIEVDVELKEQEPPSLLYHGTARRFLSSIWQKGLVKMTRQHVHLSADEETARKVGSRHGSPVVLEVNAGKMFQDGFHFFLSENGVWLTDHVPQAYLKLSEETESAV